jgi:CopG family transcriptional regulator/antitoxin EndoAI
MRNTKVVSISLPAEMLEAAEHLAKQENRTMSELVREALRVYQRERQAWQGIFAYGQANAKRLGIRDEEDVVRIIREYRQQQRKEQEKHRKTGTK